MATNYIDSIRNLPPASKGYEYNSILIDANSLPRNSLYARAAMKPASTPPAVVQVANIMSAVAAPMIFVCGANLARNGYKTAKQAFKVNDKEGKIDGIATAVAGTCFASAGVAIGVGAGLTLAKAAPYVAFLAGALTSGLVAVMYAGILGQAAYDLSYLTSFRSGFNEAWKKGDAEAFNYLAAQLTLTPEEAASPDADKIQERKIDMMIRRIGMDGTVKLVDIMAKGSRATDNEIREVLELAHQNSFKKVVKNITLILIALVGLLAAVAAIVGIFIGSGGLASISFAIAAGLWFAVDSSALHNAIGNLAYKKLNKKPPIQAVVVKISRKPKVVAAPVGITQTVVNYARDFWNRYLKFSS